MGPMIPRVDEEMMFGNPTSAKVGTSGINLDRCLSITASPLTCPARILVTTLPTLSKEIIHLPAQGGGELLGAPLEMNDPEVDPCGFFHHQNGKVIVA